MIYFLRFKSGLIKIGQSVNLKTRLRELELHPRWYGEHIVLNTMDGKPKDERHLHRQFDHLRLYKTIELFAPGKDLMDLIGRPELAMEDTDRLVRNHWILVVQSEFKQWKSRDVRRGLNDCREQIRSLAELTAPRRNLPRLQPSIKDPFFDSLFGCAWVDRNEWSPYVATPST